MGGDVSATADDFVRGMNALRDAPAVDVACPSQLNGWTCREARDGKPDRVCLWLSSCWRPVVGWSAECGAFCHTVEFKDGLGRRLAECVALDGRIKP